MSDESTPAAEIQTASRQSLLSLCSRRIGRITLPISGQLVRFRSLSEKEFSDYEAAGIIRDEETDKLKVDDARQRDARGRLLALAICDDLGKPIFTAEDVPALGEMDTAEALPLYEAVRDHCGLTAAVERRKAREAAKKNS